MAAVECWGALLALQTKLPQQEQDVCDANDAVVVDVFRTVVAAGSISAGAIVPHGAGVKVVGIGIGAPAAWCARREGAVDGRKETAAILKGRIRVVVTSARISASGFFNDHAGPVREGDIAAKEHRCARVRVGVSITPTDRIDLSATDNVYAQIQILLADAPFVAVGHAIFDGAVKCRAVICGPYHRPTTADFGAVPIDSCNAENGVTFAKVDARNVVARLHFNGAGNDGQLGVAPVLIAAFISGIKAHVHHHCF